MKRILIPCDFTESSHNAVNFAMGIAGMFGSEVLLLHITQYPVTNAEMGLSAYTYQDAREDSLEALKELAEKIKTDYGPRHIECFSEMGDTADEVEKYAQNKQADLVVMGITGHGSKLMKSLLGSSAVTAAKNINVPLIIVPPGTVYKKISSIALACDYNDPNKENSIAKAKEISSILGATLHLVHVVPEDHHIELKESFTDNYLEHHLETSPHRTFLVTEKNAASGLLSFLKNNLVDMIMIEPRKHSLFHKIFFPSTTTEVAFNSSVPVMTIHSAPGSH
jgi:nucleotide-binding universal stress UspA family protein